MLVTDDDLAAREQDEDELSTAPSVYRSTEEFGLLQCRVATVIQQLGHTSSLHMTTVYLRLIALVDPVETMRQRSWDL